MKNLSEDLNQGMPAIIRCRNIFFQFAIQKYKD